MARPPASEQVQVNFRMPTDLRDRIRQAAEENNRSLNAEIVSTLEKAYPHPSSLVDVSQLVDWSTWVDEAGDEEAKQREAIFLRVMQQVRVTGQIPPPPRDKA